MTQAELYTILLATGFPVAYSHFVATSNNPSPTPPYIAYLIANSSNFFADNKVHMKINNAQVELYTNKKDLQAEQTLEDILNQNEIAYETSETWIESEKLFQKIYYIGVI